MGNCVLKKQALDDYNKLVEIVKSHQGNPDELYQLLGGYNLDDEEENFDCNYGCITATIYWVDGEFFVLEYIDIWDDKNCEIIAQQISYTDIL